MKKIVLIFAIIAIFLGIAPLSHAMERDNQIWKTAFHPWKPERLTKMLENGFKNVDFVDKAGQTALHYAANHGDRQLVASLIQAGASVDKLSESHDTPLLLAVVNKHVPVALLLLSKGANPAITDIRGGTSLHFASESQLLTKALLQRKAPVNAGTFLDRITPLHNACHSGNIEVVKLLIEHGAAVNAVTFSEVTPLENALGMGHWEVCSHLLAHGASCNLVVDNEGLTLFHRICASGTVQQIEYCLQNGALIEQADNYGATPLLWAITGDHSENALYLINAGADVNAIWNKKGETETALSFAAFKGYDSVIQALIAKGAKLDVQGAKGASPLHRAVAEGHNSTVQLLLEAGATPNTRSSHGVSPLHHAVLKGNFPCACMLLDSKAQVNTTSNAGLTPLHDAALLGNRAMVKLLISHGACLDKLSNGTITPLMNALAKGHLEIANDLIEAGASVMIRNGFGTPLLHYVALHKNHFSAKSIEVWVNLLLKKGIDVDAQDNAGTTPLICSAQYDSISLAKALIKHGADIDAVDRYGMTALHYALQAESADIVKLLLKKGANKTLIDGKGHKILSEIDRENKKKKQQEAKKSSKGGKSKKKAHTKTFAQRQELKKEAAKEGESELVLQEIVQNVGPQPLLEPDAPEPLAQENSPAPSPAPIPVRFASRVTDWFDDGFLRSCKADCLADPCKGYWYYKSGKLYHQLPNEVVECLIRSGRIELRRNATFKDQMDTKWVLEGSMEFSDPAKNPWTTDKAIQRGFYHCTRGRDGLIYHIGFDAVNGDRTTSVDLTRATVFQDTKRAIKHVLFT